MLCHKCKREADLKLDHMSPYCNTCFCEVLERRVRKHLRDFKLKANERLVIVDNNTIEFGVAMAILKNIQKKLPLDLIIGKPGDKVPENSRMIIAWSATSIASDFLKDMMTKTKDTGPKAPRPKEISDIMILSCLNQEEIKNFAKIKNIKGTLGKDNKFKDILKKVESQYPGSTFGILKSKDLLEK